MKCRITQHRIIAFVLIMALGACGEKARRGVEEAAPWMRNQREERQGRQSSGIEYPINIKTDDEALNIIREKAQDAFPQFIRRLQSPSPGEDMFRVKYPFPADPGSGFTVEHLWLKDIRFRDGRYYGVVTNQPFHIAGINQGDLVPFLPDDISDWMYLKDGYIVGGLSIRYFISGIPELDRDRILSAYYQQFPPESQY